MTTTTELDPYAAIHDSTPGSTVAFLRRMADWLEKHEVAEAELVDASANRFDMRIHLNESEARRLFPGRSVVIDADGHAYFREDGIRFVFIEDTKPKDVREVTL